MASEPSGVVKACATLAVLLFAWLWLQWTHEAGHVLAGLATGAGVQRVVLDPLAFSRTDLAPNPRPLTTSWGGPVIGCVLGAGIPLALCAAARGWRFAAHAVAFVVLIGNGAYIGLGVFTPVGDAATMLALGTPRWVLGAFGLACLAAAWPLYKSITERPVRWPTGVQIMVIAAATLILAGAGRLFFPA